MSRHKIKTTWTLDRETGAELEVEITFEYRKGHKGIRTFRNGDPGYPDDPDEMEVVAVKADHLADAGAFNDLRDKALMERAQDWLDDAGMDEAYAVIAADESAAEEAAAELRREP